MTRAAVATLAMTGVSVAARVAVGAMWVAEGVVKYRAGFGAADILLVADGAADNSRVPGWFGPVASSMHAAPALLGFGIPLLECAIGLALVLGACTRWAAAASIATLMLYWASDQLIAQYPVMVALSAVVLAFPAAQRFGWDAWRRARRSGANAQSTSLGWRP
ncbi:DoxX family membrane protein [Leucobacter zeae]|nr:DoxX family membrane protein [Leucobacter zeae]